MASPRSCALVTVLALCALTAAGCGEVEDVAEAPPPQPSSRAGNPIPTRTTPATPPNPNVKTPNGAPRLTHYKAPTEFWCLGDEPNSAQVTIGWSAPSATTVSLTLDGRKLPTGIKPKPPFQVPAGGPTGIGATVVFPCKPATRHRIVISWRIKGSAATTRVVDIKKAPS